MKWFEWDEIKYIMTLIGVLLIVGIIFSYTLNYCYMEIQPIIQQEIRKREISDSLDLEIKKRQLDDLIKKGIK